MALACSCLVSITILWILVSICHGLNPSNFKELELVRKFEDLDKAELKSQILKLTEEGHLGILNLNISAKCQGDYQQFKTDLASFQVYARQFSDSEGKIGAGIGEGNIRWWGSYDQCTNAQKINNITHSVEFGGKYCRATYLMFTVGKCFPDSCSDEDVWQILKSNPLVAPLLRDNVCPRNPDYDAGDIVAIILCSVLALLVICGTLIDVVLRRNESEIAQLDNCTGLLVSGLLSFSVVTNLPKILNTETRPGNINVLNGIRVLSLLWVILGHSIIITWMQSDNFLASMTLMREFSFQAILNAAVAVDTFFFLSGLLVCYLTLRQMERGKGRMNWFLYYFHRFWRLTPVYMFTIMMCSTLVRRMTPAGPVMEFLQTSATLCYDTWWSHLLYINNFYFDTIETMCVSWSWYLANDMQFYCISPIIIIALYKKPWIGHILMSLLLLMCLIARGVVAYVYEINPVSLETYPDQALFDRFYIRPYYRIAPYVTGLALGYFFWHRKLKINIPRPVALIGWLVAAAINMSVLYGLYGYYRDNNAKLDNALVAYQALNKWAWSLGIAWLVLACVAGKGGWINSILSWGGWLPFVRLSYTAYLIHLVVVTIHGYSFHTQVHMDVYTMIYMFLANAVMTYMASLVIVLAVESPMVGLEKVLLQMMSMITHRGGPRSKEVKTETSITHNIPAHANGVVRMTVDTNEMHSQPQVVLVGSNLSAPPNYLHTVNGVEMCGYQNGGLVPTENAKVLEKF